MQLRRNFHVSRNRGTTFGPYGVRLSVICVFEADISVSPVSHHISINNNCLLSPCVLCFSPSLWIWNGVLTSWSFLWVWFSLTMSLDEFFKKPVILPGTASQRLRRQTIQPPTETVDKEPCRSGGDYALKYIQQEEKLYGVWCSNLKKIRMFKLKLMYVDNLF